MEGGRAGDDQMGAGGMGKGGGQRPVGPYAETEVRCVCLVGVSLRRMRSEEGRREGRRE
jgi:hypothetical protein